MIKKLIVIILLFTLSSCYSLDKESQIIMEELDNFNFSILKYKDDPYLINVELKLGNNQYSNFLLTFDEDLEQKLHENLYSLELNYNEIEVLEDDLISINESIEKLFNSIVINKDNSTKSEYSENRLRISLLPNHWFYDYIEIYEDGRLLLNNDGKIRECYITSDFKAISLDIEKILNELPMKLEITYSEETDYQSKCRHYSTGEDIGKYRKELYSYKLIDGRDIGNKINYRLTLPICSNK